uniref:Phytocyanin domain-containing protein n=1 Tax=Steinernema glaseri TaxID=37863 RepID=A0A1I7YDI3_9BILA
MVHVELLGGFFKYGLQTATEWTPFRTDYTLESPYSLNILFSPTGDFPQTTAKASSSYCGRGLSLSVAVKRSDRQSSIPIAFAKQLIGPVSKGILTRMHFCMFRLPSTCPPQSVRKTRYKRRVRRPVEPVVHSPTLAQTPVAPIHCLSRHYFALCVFMLIRCVLVYSHGATNAKEYYTVSWPSSKEHGVLHKIEYKH